MPSFSGQALSLQAKSGEEPAVPTGQQGCSSGLWLTLPAVPRPLTQSLCTGCPPHPLPTAQGGHPRPGESWHFPIFPLFYTDHQVLPAVFRIAGGKEARKSCRSGIFQFQAAPGLFWQTEEPVRQQRASSSISHPKPAAAARELLILLQKSRQVSRQTGTQRWDLLWTVKREESKE